MTTVLICDGQEQVRDELRSRLAAIPGVDRVIAFASGEALLAGYAESKPDLVLLNVQLSGLSGVETMRRLLAAHPDAAVYVLTGRTDREYAAAAFAAGARGILPKEISTFDFAIGVRGALAGADFPQQALRAVPDPGSPQHPTLTERELQVLRGMSQGRSNAEIGRQLYLSEDTIKTHARRLFRKLGVNDRAQAVALGFRRGLVS